MNSVEAWLHAMMFPQLVKRAIEVEEYRYKCKAIGVDQETATRILRDNYGYTERAFAILCSGEYNYGTRT